MVISLSFLADVIKNKVNKLESAKKNLKESCEQTFPTLEHYLLLDVTFSILNIIDSLMP
jgi:hypothetical protein